jgi:Family of unknown function (DUF6042)
VVIQLESTKVITVLDVLDQCEPNSSPMPNGLHDHGWVRLIPSGAFMIILFLSRHARSKYPLQQALQELKSIRSSDTLLIDLSSPPPVFTDDEKRKEYEEERALAEKLKAIYEASGYSYPQSLEETAELLVQFGLIAKVPVDGQTVYAPVIAPYPKPQDILKLPDDELEIIMEIQSVKEYD